MSRGNLSISGRILCKSLQSRKYSRHLCLTSLSLFSSLWAAVSNAAGMDVFSLQRLMGHTDLQVMRRYLAQTDDDLRTAHAKASPVDNAI